MKRCNVGEEEYYHWGGIYFKELFSGGIKFPQVLVVEYPGMGKLLFEVGMNIDNLSSFIEVIPLLPGSIISGYDGRPAHQCIRAQVEMLLRQNL